MARRERKTILDELFQTLVAMPSWAGPVFAVAAFALLRWIGPWGLGAALGGESADPLHKPTVMLLPPLMRAVAPWVTLLVLVVWVAALVRKGMNARRLDVQTGRESIRALSWQDFEELLSEAFRREGYLVDHTGSSQPDGGIDQRLSRGGQTTLVQCKQWRSQSVGVKVVRELLGVMTSESAQSGIVVTSGEFTNEAREFARRNMIRLIDGEELAALVRSVQRASLATDQVMAAPPPNKTSSNATVAPPECPKCGQKMVVRRAKQGANVGNQFWGCSEYPRCRGTRQFE